MNARGIERELGIPVVVARSTFLENRVMKGCRKERSQ
jgi:hypothetical protein